MSAQVQPLMKVFVIFLDFVMFLHFHTESFLYKKKNN